MSLNNKLEDMLNEHIKNVKETPDSWIIEYGKSEEDIDEVSVTGGGEAYNTPKAFKRKKKNDDDINESNFMRMAKQSFLSEASYKDYKKDESSTSKQKVNRAIKEINSRLFAIERLINQNVKLKTEDGVDSSKYWKPTRTTLYKISEKMLRISEKLRRF